MVRTEFLHSLAMKPTVKHSQGLLKYLESRALSFFSAVLVLMLCLINFTSNCYSLSCAPPNIDREIEYLEYILYGEVIQVIDSSHPHTIEDCRRHRFPAPWA